MLSDEAKDKLRQTLEKIQEWPSVYMYKFIFEPDQERLERVVALFPPESEILRKYSTGGKYLSITCTINATSREQLDALYRELCDHPMVVMVL